MRSFLTALLTTSITMSAVILLLWLLNKVFTHKIRASHRYYLWLVVLIGLLIPFRPGIPVPFKPMEISIFETAETPNGITVRTQNEEPLTEPHAKPLFEPSVASEAADIGSLTEILFGIWAIGVLAVFAFHLRSYAIFTVSVRRWGADVKDKQVLSVFRYVMNGMGFKDSAIPVKTCIFISSPLIFGFRNPTILLPEREIASDELEHIFKHELTHYKRGDLWMNLFVLLVSAMHWFNPIVYLMGKMIRADCEAACDEAVIVGSDTDKRKHYGKTIIEFIGTKAGVTPVLSTYFYGGSKNMKKRLSAIMDTSRKGKGFAAVCGIVIMLTTLLTGTVFAAATKNNVQPYIEEAQAKAIALEHAGITEAQVTFVKAHLDYEDGRVIYDIEFYSGNTEYDYEIDAINGSILEYDQDIEYYLIPNEATSENSASGQLLAQSPLINAGTYIGEAKAKDIALSEAGIPASQVSQMKVELEREDGTMVYEVEFNHGRTEYEYEIDAVSGTIRKKDVDHDD